MVPDWVIDAYRSTSQSEVILFYKGRVRQKTVVELGSFLKKSVPSKKKAKSIFGIFVELAHNILNHSEERGDEDIPNQKEGVGLLLISLDQGLYTISSGNLVSKTNIDAVIDRVNQVSGLNRQALKKRYREKRRSGEDSSQYGAGLGLLELALKSEKPLEYECYPAKDDKVLFCLKVKILKGDDE